MRAKKANQNNISRNFTHTNSSNLLLMSTTCLNIRSVVSGMDTDSLTLSIIAHLRLSSASFGDNPFPFRFPPLSSSVFFSFPHPFSPIPSLHIPPPLPLAATKRSSYCREGILGDLSAQVNLEWGRGGMPGLAPPNPPLSVICSTFL